LVLGIQVTGDRKVEPSDGRPARKISMVMREEPIVMGRERLPHRPGRRGCHVSIRVLFRACVGLTRGEPVEITSSIE